MGVIITMWKGLFLRCPHCGQGRLTRRFYVFEETCSHCGYTLLGDTGDFWGGVVISYAFAGVVGMTAGMVFTWLGWMEITTRIYASAGIGVASVLLSFPFAKAVWIHLLYHTRGQEEDYAPPSMRKAE